MTDSTITNITFWPIGVYLAGVLAVICGMLVLSYLLGQRRRDLAKSVPYESGISSTGSAHVRLSVGFFLVAIFFVIFDLEAVFIITWAIAAAELGWSGYATIFVFIGFQFAALVYLWRQGALES